LARPRRRAPETIAFLGDIHAGSWWGLWPRSRLPGDGFLGPRYLLDCWDDLQRRWPKKLDLLILAGDLIEGPQRRSGGHGVFSVSDKEQVEGAISLLRPFARRAERIIRITGTPYHDGPGDPLIALDYALEVAHTTQVLDLKLPEGILNVAHHPMGGATLYTGTQVDREGLWSTIASGAHRTHDARWIVRAHRHHWLHQASETKDVVLLPAWQLATPYAVKANYWRYQPSLGGVLMRRDPAAWGGYRFDPQLYALPLQEPMETHRLGSPKKE